MECSKHFYCLWVMYIATLFIHEIYVKLCLFWGVKLTKNANPDKCSYSGHGVGFDLRLLFLVSNKEKKDISVFGEGPTQVLDWTTIGTEF